MKGHNRREILKSGGAVLAAGVLGSVGLSVRASGHESKAGHGGQHEGRKGVDAFVVSASEEGICATCRYWGGVRRATEDRHFVHCESLGWCNNPDSHNYQTMTTPNTGPMKAWKKWEAL